MIAFQSVDIVKQQEQEAKKRAAAAPSVEKQEIRTRYTGSIPIGVGSEISAVVSLVEEKETKRGMSSLGLAPGTNWAYQLRHHLAQNADRRCSSK